MNKRTGMGCAWLGMALLWPVWGHADIVQRVQFTAMAADKDSEGADVLTVAETTACGGHQVRMRQGLLQNPEPYVSLRPALEKRIREGIPMVVTLFACPTGQSAEAAIPHIRLITGCDPNTCADSHARLYLDEQLAPQARRRSPYVLQLPLPAGPDGTWKVEIADTVRPDRIRISGFTTAADFVSGHFVGAYRAYDLDGQLETEAQLDAQGLQHGLTVTYYPDGKVRSRRTYGAPGVLLRSQLYDMQGVLTHDDETPPQAGCDAGAAGAACAFPKR